MRIGTAGKIHWRPIYPRSGFSSTRGWSGPLKSAATQTKPVMPLEPKIMVLGIDIRVIYEDRDMFELRVRASNGEFTAQAEMYVDLESCRALAGGLRGFPTGKADTREFELGTFKTDHAGGGARMRFSCLDSAGHSAVKVQIRNDGRRSGRTEEAAYFDIPVEPAAVDLFVEQMEKMSRVGDGARLEATRKPLGG